jgi:hypothetical protein
VGASGESLCKGVIAFVALHELGQAGAVHGALVRELLGQGDGLAVLVQGHEHRHVLFGATYTQMYAVRLPQQHVGKVVFPAHDFVTDARPAGFFAGNDFDAIFLIKAQDGRHHDAGAVRERNEADLDFGLLGGVGACGVHRGAQGRVDADGAHRSSLQNSAAAEFGFQKIRHVSSSRR